MLKHIVKNLNFSKNISKFVIRQSSTQISQESEKLINSNNIKLNYRSVWDVPFHEPLKVTVTDIIPKEEAHTFMSVTNEVINSLAENSKFRNFPEVIQWYKKIFQYNLPSGRETPGLTCVMMYKLLAEPNQLTTENIRLAHILGLCAEMSHVIFNIVDDLMDHSTIRRGMTSWYLLKNVGTSVLRDSVIMENTIYEILKIYFHKYPFYRDLCDMYHETIYKTTLGQMLDMFVCQNEKGNLEHYTMDNYKTVVYYKGSCILANAALVSAVYLAGIYDKGIHKIIEKIYLALGEYYTIENCYLDCFGVEVSGKHFGEDIREKKLSWPIAAALEIANPDQKKILEQHFGYDNDDSVMRVYNLYKELELPKIYQNYRNKLYTELDDLMSELPPRIPPKVIINFREVLNGMHN